MFSGKSSPLQRKPTADDQADADADIALQKLAIDAQWKSSDGRCTVGVVRQHVFRVRFITSAGLDALEAGRPQTTAVKLAR